MYPKQNSFTSRLFPALMVVATVMSATTSAAAQDPVGRYHGLVVNMQADVPGTATTQVNIVINRWSTPEEQEQVMTTALEQGGKALLGVLQKLPAVGSLAPIGGVGFNLPYATRSRGVDGIERILLLVDRPMSFTERWYGGRSTDYPFMLIEMEIKPGGQGEGRIVVAGRLTADKFNRTLVVENLDLQPLRLTNIRRER